MATTVSSFVSGEPTTSPGSYSQPVKAEMRIDFSDTNVSSTNVVQSLNIPAGALVTNVIVRVVTAEDATATATVGDGDDPNGWIASLDLNATGTTFTAKPINADAYPALGGRLYTSADTIDLVVGADLDACVLDIAAEYSMLEAVASA